MRKPLLGALILAATVATGPRSAVAQNDPWCLVNDQKGSTSCAFLSHEQCLHSAARDLPRLFQAMAAAAPPRPRA